MNGRRRPPNYIFVFWMIGTITVIAAGALTDLKLGLFLVGIMALLSAFAFSEW